MENKETIIRVTGLKKVFGETTVLKGIDADICRGDVVCVIGASGAGKAARCLAIHAALLSTKRRISASFARRGQRTCTCPSGVI